MAASIRLQRIVSLAAELTPEERALLWAELETIEQRSDPSARVRGDEPRAKSIPPSPSKEIVDKLSAFVRQQFGPWTGPVPTLDEVKQARRELWSGYVEGDDEP